MATFTASASLSSPAGNFLIGNTLSVVQQKTQTVNKDASLQTLYIAPNSTQIAYLSSDPDGSVSEQTYVYMQSVSTNPSNGVDIIFTTRSVDVKIGHLKPGDWAYVPYVHSDENSATSSSLKLKNINSTTASFVTVLFGESGSL